MKKQELDQLIEEIGTPKGSQKTMFQFRNDPAVSVKVLYLLDLILKFRSRFGSYKKDGSPRRLRLWRMLLSRSARKALYDILEATIAIFRKSENPET